MIAKERVRVFVLKNFPLAKSRGIADTTKLLEEGLLDSLGILDLVEHLEKEMGIVVKPEDLIPENFGTIDDIAAYVETQMQTK